MAKRLQIGAKRFQIGTEITNWGKRDFKSEQRLQIGAEQIPQVSYTQLSQTFPIVESLLLVEMIASLILLYAPYNLY